MTTLENPVLLSRDEAENIRESASRVLTMMSVISHLHNEEMMSGKPAGGVCLEDVIDITESMADQLYQAVNRPVYDTNAGLRSPDSPS